MVTFAVQYTPATTIHRPPSAFDAEVTNLRPILSRSTRIKRMELALVSCGIVEFSNSYANYDMEAMWRRVAPFLDKVVHGNGGVLLPSRHQCLLLTGLAY